MLNLLTAEKIKLLGSNMLFIVLSVFLLLSLFQVVMAVYDGGELIQTIDTIVNGATGILMMEKNALTIVLVISAFVSFYIGEEFQNGTIRNALALGGSRIHYYSSKFVMAALISLVGVSVMTGIGIISYSIAFGFGEVAGVTHYLSYAIKTFIALYSLILANVSIYILISFLTRNAGVSLIWSFLYTLGTGFGAGIFQQTERFKHVTFWFTESFLFYSDFAKPADIAKYPEMIWISFITVVISSTVGILLFNRTDIK